ncbi:cell division protein ZapA [Treponema pectinovorum]|uniref:cell division protein ZapA n=1 Tax=Treponema pectinovorum TaxID=164 RepID=UPI003D8C9423
MGTLQIDLLGTSFSIKATEDDEYLKKLFGYYKSITEEIQKTGMMKNNTHIAILAGIMLCDELYKEKSKNVTSAAIQDNTESKEAEKHTQQIIEKLKSVLGE